MWIERRRTVDSAVTPALVGLVAVGAALTAPLAASLYDHTFGGHVFWWTFPSFLVLPVAAALPSISQAVGWQRPNGVLTAGWRWQFAYGLVPLVVVAGGEALGAPIALRVATSLLLAFPGAVLLAIPLLLPLTREVVALDPVSGIWRLEPLWPFRSRPELTKVDRAELRPGPWLVLIGAGETRVMLPDDPWQAHEKASALALAIGVPLTVVRDDAPPTAPATDRPTAP